MPGAVGIKDPVLVRRAEGTILKEEEKKKKKKKKTLSFSPMFHVSSVSFSGRDFSNFLISIFLFYDHSKLVGHSKQ